MLSGCVFKAQKDQSLNKNNDRILNIAKPNERTYKKQFGLDVHNVILMLA